MTTPGVAEPGTLFAGVDRAVFAAAFADRLRRAGLDVTFPAIERCTAGLQTITALTLAELYWLTRVSYASGRNELAIFDAVFDAVFGSDMGRLPTDRRGQQRVDESAEDDRLLPVGSRLDGDASSASALPWATLPSVTFEDVTDDNATEDDTAIPELRPSATASDMDRRFDELDDLELERVGVLLEAAIPQWPLRKSRRRQAARSRGPLSLRRSMRRSMATGGDLVTLVHTRPRHQPRPVVVLLDVSGSMETYARAYLHLTRPLAVNHRAEVFAFATDLSRVTATIRLRSTEEAIEHMSDTVGDRFSGSTRGDEPPDTAAPSHLEHVRTRCSRRDL